MNKTARNVNKPGPLPARLEDALYRTLRETVAQIPEAEQLLAHMRPLYRGIIREALSEGFTEDQIIARLKTHTSPENMARLGRGLRQILTKGANN